MQKPTILVGMSGGVDSSVSALQMLRSGFSCLGGTMRLHREGCGGEQDVEDARAVAGKLGIPFHMFDFQDVFQEKVMERFVRSYERGATPNPCVDCNRFLKFDALLRAALELGCGGVATGHYARVRFEEASGRYLLYKAVDKSKDQSYFLASLSQWQLAHTHFPLGELTKQQVREIAEENDFVNARKRDSQDICFVPDGNYVAFLEKFTGKQYAPGNYLDLHGNVVGQHRGAVCYTLGQRKGLGIAMGEPVYVCGKDMAQNTVTVGPNEALFSQGLVAGDWNWYPFPALTQAMEVTARIRHSQAEYAATVYPTEEGKAKVIFREKQRAITPGQAVVLYQGDLVIGGGTIVHSI